MNQEQLPVSSLPKELPVLAVLGLSKPGEGDWERLLGLQYSGFAQARLARIGIHAFAALAAAGLLIGSIHPFAIVAWLALLAGAVHNCSRIDGQLADTDRRRITRAEIKRQSIGSVLIALTWTIPFAGFGPFASAETRLQLWTVIAMLMTASAIMLPAAPMSILIFTGIVGCAALLMFLFTGLFAMAALSLLFVGVIAIGAIEGARRYLKTKVAEAGMAETNEVVSLLLREFEENEADWLWQTDPTRLVRSASPRFAFALGKEPQEIEGKPFIQLISGPAWDTGQFPPSLHDLAERLKRRENFSNLLVRVSIAGQERWWELSGTPKTGAKGNFDGFRGVGSDVTEQRESSDKIAWMARYDTLTGLPNRMLLTEAMAEAMKYAQQWRTRCAFLMIDLDRFKSVNDSLGHPVGDKLLAQVSERLREQMTENEVCGRLGGDEFAIVVRDASDLARVDKVARRVIERLSEPYDIDHHTLYVGASVGSAIGPRDGSTVETLMRNADLALYRSKGKGGGRHFTYEPELHADAEERRQLEFSLRRALERNEFLLHFQPVVDSRSESIVSFEALVRWQSAEHGFVSPGKFVPLAEDTRLIVPIGEWVLYESCRQAMHWPDHIRVAVNVSGEQLLDSNFLASVVGALSSSGLPAHRLEVEVTESIFVRDAALARAALEQVMALGCGVSLDDFGTGYSSLNYLQRLRFTTIKVDRSFVQSAATGNRESLAIIRAVVAMADSLEMSTTAEGVETERELDLVRKLGCKKIQGFFFGRPVPAEDALAMFRPRPKYAIAGNAA